MGIFIAWAAHATPAPAADIAILLSGEMDAYHSCLRGSRSELAGFDLFEASIHEHPGQSRLVSLIEEHNPRAILGIGVKATKFAQEMVTHVPLVYAMVFNPFELDLVTPRSVGVAMIASPEAQIGAMQEVIPGLKRIGVIYDEAKSWRFIEEGRAAAAKRGITLVEKTVSSSQEISNALKKIIPEINCLWLLPDTTVVSRETFHYLLNVTLQHNIPIFSFSEGFVKSGAFAALAPDYTAVGKESARVLHRLVRGNAPEKPLAYPPGDLCINLHTAEALKLEIPDHVRKKAKQLY